MHHNQKYRLILRQQPQHGRLFGGSDKDRRMLDPPPILELLSVDENDQLYPIIKDSRYYCVRVELCRKLHIPKQANKPLSIFPCLVGTLIENSRVLTDDLGRIGTFFIFNDLSIRDQGIYVLKFSFFDLESEGSLITTTTAAAVIFSKAFPISTAREFKGVLKSSALTKVFKSQGVKLTIKK
ncbi:hypothetical protein HDU92_008984 [Lobulomyces angularis]|nr:hypothetical protein HDU92_008984 [Lobulomyces angularis]